jgi:hypothetical protein
MRISRIEVGRPGPAREPQAARTVPARVPGLSTRAAAGPGRVCPGRQSLPVRRGAAADGASDQPPAEKSARPGFPALGTDARSDAATSLARRVPTGHGPCHAEPVHAASSALCGPGPPGRRVAPIAARSLQRRSRRPRVHGRGRAGALRELSHDRHPAARRRSRLYLLRALGDGPRRAHLDDGSAGNSGDADVAQPAARGRIGGVVHRRPRASAGGRRRRPRAATLPALRGAPDLIGSKGRGRTRTRNRFSRTVQ